MEEMAPVFFIIVDMLSWKVYLQFLLTKPFPKQPLQVHNSVGLQDPRTEDVMWDKYMSTMTS